jgi:hypothetical protein
VRKIGFIFFLLIINNYPKANDKKAKTNIDVEGLSLIAFSILIPLNYAMHVSNKMKH